MGVKYDWELVRRRQFFEDSRETVYRHALECLESARSEKKKKVFVPTEEAPGYC